MSLIQGYVLGVAQTADLVLAVSDQDASLRAWSKEGALVLEMQMPNKKPAYSVAAQGMLAAVGTRGGGLFLIDLSSATVLHALEGHTNNVWSVILDGDEVLSASYDKTIRVWDTVSGACTQTIHAEAAVRGLAANEDWIVAGLSDATVRVFDRASGDQRHKLREATGWVMSVALDNMYMVSGANDGKVRVYAVPSFTLVHVLEGHTATVSSVAIEGDSIVSGSDDKTVRLWNAHTGAQLRVLQGLSHYARSVSLLGSEIVSGSYGKSVRIWNANTGALKFALDGTEAAQPITDVLEALELDAAAAAAQEALKAALANGDPGELGRCKLMIIGQGAAGKTSTVRSLLGMKPEKVHISTVGVELRRTSAELWSEEAFDSGFKRQAMRAAALRMRTRKRPTLRSRISRRASSMLPGRRRLSAQTFVAEEEVELVAEAEVAQRFDIAEIENMAGKTQSGQTISFTIWDYAGQDVFYTLHHIFLTQEGVYMLVFNMNELLQDTELALDYLSFWLNSVKLHAPKAPVILVGTHYDQAFDSLQAVEAILRNDLQALRGVKLVKNSLQKVSFFPLDNMSTAEDRAVELRNAVERTASKLDSVSQKISLRWLKVIDDLMMLDCDHVPFEVVQELAEKYHAGDQTDELLKYFHELGMVVHLRTTDTLHDKVVLNPQWLLNKLARVIADDIHVEQIYYDEKLSDLELDDDFKLLRDKGIGTFALLSFLWDDEEVAYLLEFMRDTMLLSDWAFSEKLLRKSRDDGPLYLVSSLLKTARSDDLDAKIAEMDIGLTCVLDFSEFFLPDGVFARLLSLCAQYSGDIGSRKHAPQLAGRQAIIRFGLSVFALEQIDDKIWIRVEKDSDKPASTLKMLVSMFQGARDAMFRGLPWDLLLQSPKNPSILVSYDDIVDAFESGVESMPAIGTKNAKLADFVPFFEDGSLKEDEEENQDGTAESPPSFPLSSDLQYHVFLSHKQVEAGDACNLMADKLISRGLKVWVDQRADGNLSREQMQNSIRASKCYLLFLTKTVFGSRSVCMELETALQAKRPILLVHESDPNRVGFANFSTYPKTAPRNAKHLFREAESMPFQRRLYLAQGFYNELVARIEGAEAN
ncbi:WD repeat-containing protein pop2 [Hondaea fermentalgiana]|uniref:non-specific serine/threonine protein kinase n=1 Tax=Hondaea fermentalgiana TaxID=2315210 RepID=A0A2R5GM95_9STRA|nr:WD repeat-containing protein pop2 [Hondaea fermentalgiana]|eukprot:GBG30858.1 WD repeat-containing protein pop2 [Hondaea fermentalgiana]